MTGRVKVCDVVPGASASPVLRAALAFLRRAPAGEVYTQEALASAVRFSVFSLDHYIRRGEFEPYRLRNGRRYLYGSTAAIAALRRQLESS